jgi:hypothetical protein
LLVVVAEALLAMQVAAVEVDCVQLLQQQVAEVL